ncbi:hypothetical protein ACFVTE_09635 [Arthrobacter sp. NPDC058097]|uniref:hypothetical protein n=1 Tax=Arthrobacter sp. NPDC058097 TaxID=3346340 RepID=UPI0036DCE04C
MDESSRKPPSAAKFRIAMVIIVLLIATAVWFGMSAMAHLLGPVWDTLVKR